MSESRSHLKQLSWTWQGSSVACPVTGSSVTPLGCNRTGDSKHESAPEKPAGIVWCNQINIGSQKRPSQRNVFWFWFWCFLFWSYFEKSKWDPTQYYCSVPDKVLGECMIHYRPKKWHTILKTNFTYLTFIYSKQTKQSLQSLLLKW